MALHAFLTAIVALLALLVLLAGLSALFLARPSARVGVRMRRWIRNRLWGGEWSPEEMALYRMFGRRGYYLFLPKDVRVETPEDLDAYLLSDRFWGSRLVRLFHIVAGLFLILGALFIFGVLVSKPP
ncbi:MAG: hypothetical protein IIB21_05625 [Chloroflexi bacterium]|nr:hypothetical protein [Chloroflexota bacterium]